MRPEELMIGDIVTFKDCQYDKNPIIVKIWQINQDGDAFAFIDDEQITDGISIDDEVVGLPLTPEILEKVGFDLDKAKQIYEWLNDKPTADAVSTNTKKPVSIHYDATGKADGILVQTFDQSFILNLHDEEEGKQMNWKDAMNYKMPTIRQWLLVMVYKDQVNRCLVEARGEELKTEECYWSSTEGGADCAWSVYFGGTYSSNLSKGHSHYVRAVAAF